LGQRFVIRILFRNIFRYGSNTASLMDTPTVTTTRTTSGSSNRVIGAAQMHGSPGWRIVRGAIQARASAMPPEMAPIRNVFQMVAA
jgi:hypothetical protein